MRALLLTNNRETKILVGNLFRTHFSKIKVINLESENEAVQEITNNGDAELVMIDADDRELEPRKISDKLTELAGDITKVFIGNKININSRAYVNVDIIEEKDDELAMTTPIDVDIFKSIIETIMAKLDEESFANSIIEGLEEDFLPLKVRNFYMYDTIPFDAYIKLTKEKYALVLQQGKKYSHSYIYSYVRKQVRYFYLAKDDHIKALESLMATIAKDLHPDVDLETKKLIETQIQGISLIQEYLKLIGITDQVSLMTRLVLDSLLRTFKRVKSEREIIKFIDFSRLDSAEISLLTFKVCVSIIKGMKWDADLTKLKLGLASIIHDCTLPNENMYKISDLHDPNFTFFEEEDQEKFKTHPTDAAKFAQHFNEIPEVDFIISQHHEMPDGSGFPNKLNGHTLTTLSAIFILSNNFVSELYRTNVSKETLKSIMTKFSKYDRGNFKDPLKILNDVIRYNIL